VVFYCKSTEPTVNVFRQWMDIVWNKREKEGGSQSVVLCDSYEVHKAMKEESDDDTASSKWEIFPPGTACKLQPINVFARRTFMVIY